MQALDPAQYRDIVRRALEEDIGGGDVTSEATVPEDEPARGGFLVKGDWVLPGLALAIEAFRQLDPDVGVALRKRDGDRCAHPGGPEDIGEVVGDARALLAGERT